MIYKILSGTIFGAEHNVTEPYTKLKLYLIFSKNQNFMFYFVDTKF